MKLVNTGEGLRHYMSREHQIYPDCSRYESLRMAATRKSAKDLEFGDNILMQYGDDDIYYILKIDNMSLKSISGRIIQTNTTDFAIDDWSKLEFDDNDYDDSFYVVSNEELNKSFDCETYLDNFLKSF